MIQRHAIAVGLFTALFVSPNLLAPLNTYDGGLASSAGTFILHGELPYRDFWWLYGPAAPILSAASGLLFGPSIFLVRLLGLVAIGVQGAFAYALIRGRVPHVAAATIVVGALGVTSFADGVDVTAWSVAMALALAGLYLRGTSRNVTAGVVVGLALLARLDLGAYALIAVLLSRGPRDVLLGFAIVAVPFGVLALATAPFGDLIQQLGWFPLVGTRQFRAVPAPRVEDLLSFLLFLTVVLIPKLAIAACAAIARWRGPRPSSLVSLIVFAALCQLQTVSRADLYHQAQAALPGLMLVGYLAGPTAVPSRERLAQRVAYARLGLFTVLATITSISLMFGAFSLLRMEKGTLSTADRAFVAGVRTITANTTADDPIFVGLTENRYTLLNPMLAYYLANRRSGTWGTMYNPGITNTDAVQSRMVAELTASQTPLLYLDDTWAMSVESTNESAIAGSTILDTFIASTYVTACDFGGVRILALPSRLESVSCVAPRQERLLDILGGVGP